MTEVPRAVGSAARHLALGLISLDYDGPAELFAAAAARRLDHVEVFLDVSVTEDDLELMLSWRDRGIRVASVSSLAKLALPADADALDHQALVRRSIELAAAVGAPFATFMYGSGYNLDPAVARERFLRRIEPLVSHAADRGVGLLIENVFSRGGPGDLDTVEATLALFDRINHDAVGLNFDPANYTIAGEEGYPRAYRELRPLIRSLHLKDVRPLEDGDYPLGTHRVMDDHRRGPFLVVPLGRGLLDVDGLLAELLDDELDVIVSLEPTAKAEDREHWLDTSLAFLAECGVARERPNWSEEEIVR